MGRIPRLSASGWIRFIFQQSTVDRDKGDWLCQVVMEQGRKEKAPVPAEGWGLVAVEDERDAAGDKAEAAARDKTKVKVAARQRGRAETSNTETLFSGKER